MDRSVVILFCICCVQCEVTLEADRPSIQVEVSQNVILKCCFNSSEKENFVWIKSTQHRNENKTTEALKDAETERQFLNNGKQCGILTLRQVKLGDNGFYRCYLNVSKVLTHGTYLQIYMPIEKTIKLSESVKNRILTAEGILLLLCVILPSVALLFKSRNLNELEKKKVTKEEENIYQGLNLDDCCAAYDYIEHGQKQDAYEDVGSQEEDMELEKP